MRSRFEHSAPVEPSRADSSNRGPMSHSASVVMLFRLEKVANEPIGKCRSNRPGVPTGSMYPDGRLRSKTVRCCKESRTCSNASIRLWALKLSRENCGEWR